MSQPETWLMGKVDGFADAVMPAVHSLTQARRELADLREIVSTDDCRVAPGGAASIGFHIAHIGGSLDRLFTYARGEALSADQLDQLRCEAAVATGTSDELFTATLARIDCCLDALERVSEDSLYEPRSVGRGKLPSTVIGLLFHAAEHTTMHVGQIRTTLKVIRGLRTQ